MFIWFLICIVCMTLEIALHFKSVEHINLKNIYGYAQGIKIGKYYGIISGTMEFIFLIGLWISPQPIFSIPIISKLIVPIVYLKIPLINLVLSLPLIAFGALISIQGVNITGIKVAGTHSSPRKIEITGVYSIVRHPQYLGWIFAHVGFSILLSVLYSILYTPILIVLIYLVSKKEEDELIKEYGKDYEDYQKRVPMLIPKLRIMPKLFSNNV